MQGNGGNGSGYSNSTAIDKPEKEEDNEDEVYWTRVSHPEPYEE
jgi:hypothetical protein